MRAEENPDIQPRVREETPFVSVIVPVFNDPVALRRCLQAIENQTYRSDCYEVIVVDNASSEPLRSLIEEFPHAVAEYEAAPGSYPARNRGIARARGDVLAFTDADCIPDSGWIAAGIERIGEDGFLVGGRIDVFPKHEPRPNAVELYEMLYAFAPEDHAQAGFASTANLFTRRAVFDDVGLFDPALKSFGDVIWTSRAVSAGYGLRFSDFARVRHPARRSLYHLYRRYARFAGGHYDRASRCSRRLLRERFRAALMLLPPAKLATRVLTSVEPAPWDAKLKVIAVAYYARLSYLLEWCRLELGGESRRG